MHLFVTFCCRQYGIFQDPIELRVQLKSASSIVWNVAFSKIPVGAWIIVVHDVDLERTPQATPDCHFDSIGLWLIVYTRSCSSWHGWCCLCFNDNDNDDYYGQHHQTYCQHIFDLPNLVKFPCVLHPPTLPHRVLSSWPCPIHAMRYPAMSRCIYHLSLCTHPRLMVICLASST